MNPTRLLTHFDRLAEAPDAIPRLRRFILDLAVRGKLVEQYANDESASELLKRIQSEKVQFVKDGKIKRQDPLPPIDEDDIPYSLPHGWQWARFIEVAAIQSNLVNPRDYQDSPHIAPDNIESATGRLLPYETIGDAAVFSSKHLFFTGSILYSKIRPALAKAVIVDFDGLCSADMYPILPFVSRLYLHKFMISGVFVQQAVKEDTRVAMPKINQAALAKILVAVPPISEQHRIVAKVNELMALCDRLEAAQVERDRRQDRLAAVSLHWLNLNDDVGAFREHARFYLSHIPLFTTRAEQFPGIRRTILNLAVRGRLVPQDPKDEPADMLYDRLKSVLKRNQQNERTRARKEVISTAIEFFRDGTFPHSWVLTNFDSVNIIVSGVAKGKDLRGLETESFPYLRVANVQRGYLNLNVVKELEIRADELERYRLQRGDVLMTEGGDWDKLGRAAIWNAEVPNCIHQNHIYRIRSADKEELLPEWIMLFANSPLGRSYFEGASKQTTNLASINMTQLRSCPLPLPPLAEQHRIVAKVDELMAVCDRLEAQLTTVQTESRRLLESVLHEALASTGSSGASAMPIHIG